MDREGHVRAIEARSTAGAVYAVNCVPDIQRLGESLTEEDVLLVIPLRGPLGNGEMQIRQARGSYR
jgi:hypothetical protein